MKQITYGLGGFDPSKPNNNIIEEIEVLDEINEQELATLTPADDALTILDNAIKVHQDELTKLG
jgi:hypothetical protein